MTHIAKLVAASTVFWIGLVAHANSACPGFGLQNGTTADADAVMAWIYCRAPIDNPALVGTVGVSPAGGSYSNPSFLNLLRGTMSTLSANYVGIGYVNNGGLLGNNEALVFNIASGGNDYRFKVAGTDVLTIAGADGAVGLTNNLAIRPAGGSYSNPAHLTLMRGAMPAPSTNYVNIGYVNGGGILGSNEALVFKIGNSGNDFRFMTGDTDRLVINGANGNVGIGITDPKQKLHTEGIILSRASLPGFAAYTDATGGSEDGWQILASYDGPGLFLREVVSGSGTARMVIASGGNVGIGVTSPAQRLEVSGTIRQSTCANAPLSANSSGDIVCTSSDIRLKNVSGLYEGGLKEIERIVPVRFRYKPTRSNPGETVEHAGFTAQNVQSVIPQAVARQKDGYYSLESTAVLAAAVNAIKELKAINDRQARQIHLLQRQVSALSRDKVQHDASNRGRYVANNLSNWR